MKHLTIAFCLFYLILSTPNLVLAAKVLNYTTEIVTDGKKLWENNRVIIQINSPSDNEYCEFEIPYSKNESLEELSASIKDVNGNLVRKLTKKEITTSSYFSNIAFFSDNMVKSFTMLHNQYPYLIELSYNYEYASFLSIARWDPIWDTAISTEKASLSFTFPKDYLFKKEVRGIDSANEQTTNEELRTIKWTSSYVSANKWNSFMPPMATLNPRVILTPEKFNYIEVGSFKSWETFGEWENLICKDLDVLPLQEQTIVDKLIGNSTDRKEIISKLYHYLQDNTHYTLVEIDFGGMQPYPADYVCKNRYGDCKALSNYLKALLRYKNIESSFVLVKAGENKEEINPNFPAQQFNHVFLCVPMTNDTIWLECTSNTSPINYLGTFTQNRTGFLIKQGKSHLVNLPALKETDCLNTAVIHYESDENDKSMVETAFRFRGKAYEQLVSLYKHGTNSEKEDLVNSFLPFKNVKLNNWAIVSSDRDATFIDLKANVEVKKPYAQIANFLRIDHPTLLLPTFEKENDRLFDVMLHYPISSVDTIYYSSDFPGMKLKDQANIVVDSKYGHFEIVKSLTDKTLTVVRKLSIPAQTIPLKEYPEFYKFYTAINNSAKSTLLTKE